MQGTENLLAVAAPQLNENGTPPCSPSSRDRPDRRATETLVHDIRDRVAGRRRRRRRPHRPDRGRHRRLGEALRRDAGLPAARGRPVGPAADAGLPVPAGAAQGGARLPAHRRRHLRHHRAGVPAGPPGGLVGLDTPGPLVSFLPILLIGILFGLAMDYEVFLVSRMREDFVHGDPPPGHHQRHGPRRPGGHRRRADHDLGLRRLHLCSTTR